MADLQNITQGLLKFGMSTAGKWIVAGLSVVLASLFVVPLLKKIPFFAKMTAGMSSIVTALVLLAVAVVAIYFARNIPLVKYIAGGLGVAAAVQLVTSFAAPVLSRFTTQEA